MDADRYAGKPLVRLLELYVLRSIGQLPQPEEQKLTQMAPKLHALYGGNGEWHDAIASSMKMPGNMPALIADTWKKNLDIAASRGATLTPNQFAQMFVDVNFVPPSA